MASLQEPQHRADYCIGALSFRTREGDDDDDDDGLTARARNPPLPATSSPDFGQFRRALDDVSGGGGVEGRGEKGQLPGGGETDS